MNQHLTVSYLDEAGIELRVDIDVSAATFENNADGGVIKWRNTRTGNQPENSPGGGGGFLSSLVSAATGAAAGRPAHRERPRPRRPRPTTTAPAVEVPGTAPAVDGGDAPTPAVAGGVDGGDVDAPQQV